MEKETKTNGVKILCEIQDSSVIHKDNMLSNVVLSTTHSPSIYLLYHTPRSYIHLPILPSI